MWVERTHYLNKLKDLKDRPLIKVITGIRRSGKSVLLAQFQDWLQNQNVSNEQIISINLEDMVYEKLLEYHALYSCLLEKTKDSSRRFYIFLDEVQNCVNFEKVINSLRLHENLDIYVTGSNSRLLSGELSTLLSGRYMELSILPLSFQEYLTLTGLGVQEGWEAYFAWGGFPYLSAFEKTENRIDYIDSVFNTILIRDIVSRKQITNLHGFQRTARFMIDNIGNPTNPTRIANTLSSQGQKTTMQTVQKYLEGLEEAFILYAVEKEDLKGLEILRSPQKYYLSDVSFRRLFSSSYSRDRGHVLENIIFLELIRRDYKVRTGSLHGLEVDFIASRGNQKFYVQVSQSVQNPDTYQREIAPLLLIQDAYPKYLITLDEHPEAEKGIIALSARDFLLESQWNLLPLE